MLKCTTQRFARAAAPLTALLGLGGLLTGAAHAQTVYIPVYSTGQTSLYYASTQTQALNTARDYNWTVNNGNSYATSPNSAWLGNDGNSKWISNVLSSTTLLLDPGSAPGSYTFQTSFEMPSNVNLSTATISFLYAADNSLTSVKVNDATVSGISGGGYDKFSSAVTLDSSNALFKTGTNTLTFIVQNLDDGKTANPMGLRVQFTNATASLQGSAAPEPASVALVALGGLPALGIVARRRRNKA